MSERITVDNVEEFQNEVHQTLETLNEMLEHHPLEELRRESRSIEITSDVGVIAHAAHLALLASATGLGECREKTPYASLYPLIDQNGQFKWCCTHDPSHCSP